MSEQYEDSKPSSERVYIFISHSFKRPLIRTYHLNNPLLLPLSPCRSGYVSCRRWLKRSPTTL